VSTATSGHQLVDVGDHNSRTVFLSKRLRDRHETIGSIGSV
jgi:hypothetical protein